MAEVYQEPLEIEVQSPSSFTSAALNKCLFITNEYGLEATEKISPQIKTFSSSEEVSKWYGNNSNILKAIEFYLGQKRYPAKQPLKPTFFTILSVKNEGTTKNDVIEGLNTALGYEFYAITHNLDNTIIAEGDLNSWMNEHRKILFEENTNKATNIAKKSDRYIKVYNAKSGEEYKAAAYMATVITSGAASKADMNIVNMCSPDVSGGERQELTAQCINFTEKRTSKDYVIVRNGVATDGTTIEDVTAIDYLIYNLMDNIEILMAESGVEQDDRGYDALESKLTQVMEEAGEMGILAKERSNYAFSILSINQSATDRQLNRINCEVVFRLKGWARAIKLILKRTYDEVNKGE